MSLLSLTNILCIFPDKNPDTLVDKRGHSEKDLHWKMDILDTVLPFFVDYLGCYEIGINGIENPYDVMKGM